MTRNPSLLAACVLLSTSLATPARAEDPPRRTVEEVAEASRPAVVTVSSADRRGDARGSGTAFIVPPGNIVITNLHVIGEHRAFQLTLSNGSALKPIAILAHDPASDLAAIEVEEKGLPSLDLGDSTRLRPGQTVLAVGNPLGFGLSVMSGSVAELKDLEGRRLVQLAMPIEPGSSGSPVIDLEGKAVGVVRIKSGTAVGFAVPSSDVKELLAKPRVIPMERWLTMGSLDSKEWRVVLGGDWKRHAGRIAASGMGGGFGGRTLCLREGAAPEGDFDLAVEVRLADESGAAGLVFSSDGGERHYGFYPTAGNLRLTRFEGPDVFSWTILKTVSSGRYRAGDWNEVLVRVRGSKLTCLVNGEAVIEVEEPALSLGKVGLCKFREPRAEFRRFRWGKDVQPRATPAEPAARAGELAARVRSGAIAEAEAEAEVAALGEEGARSLRELAASLEADAARLRALADRGRAREAERALAAAFDGKKDEEVDLLRAALLVARLDDPDLEIEPYLDAVDGIAGAVRAKLGEKASDEEKLAALSSHLFNELGFRGSEGEYYDRANSYVSDVLDDREGIPITLSVLFIEAARRLGLEAVGVAIPRHFIVEVRPREGERKLIDVFGGGTIVTRLEAEALAGGPLEEKDFAPATRRQVIVRMLHNLLGVAQAERDRRGMLRYLDAILAVAPDGVDRAEVEALRSMLRRSQ